jgi:hypothetical protein
MMNPIGIRDEDQIGSRGWRFEDRTAANSVLEHGGAVRAVEGSEVGMAGMAERYWQELRPSDAGRFGLDASIRHDRERTERSHTGRALRRHRRRTRPKLRTTAR